jgi:hypothetical protein
MPSPSEERHLTLHASLHLEDGTSLSVEAFLDGGSQMNLIDSNFVTAHSLTALPLDTPRQGWTIDGNRMDGLIEFYVAARLSLGSHIETVPLFITRTPSHPITLGAPWHRRHSPHIDWSTDAVTFRSQFCLDNCRSPGTSPKASPSPPFISKVSSSAFRRLASKKNAFVFSLSQDFMKAFKALQNSESSATSVVHPDEPGYEDYLKKTIPPIFHEYHSIDLEPGKEPPFGKIYPLSELELRTLSAWIKDNLERGLIRPSQSPAGAPVFFVRKGDGSIKFTVDYRGLNQVTVKNRYPLPLIGEALDRLKRARFFSKIDLRYAYNLVRIKPGDEWKTAFRTRYGHFETLVMQYCKGITCAVACDRQLTV